MVGGKEPTYECDQAFLCRARSSSNDPTSPKGTHSPSPFEHFSTSLPSNASSHAWHLPESPSAPIQSGATIQSSLIVKRKGSYIEYTL
jgi:hypothetical protein